MLHPGCTGLSADLNLQPLCTTSGFMCSRSVCQGSACFVCAVCSAPVLALALVLTCAADYHHHGVGTCGPSIHVNLMPVVCVQDGCPLRTADARHLSICGLPAPVHGACRPCINYELVALCVQEAAPPGVAERYRRSSAIGTPGKQAYGVRMGAGVNSYVVRDKQIEVLKNVHGGVRVRQIAI